MFSGKLSVLILNSDTLCNISAQTKVQDFIKLYEYRGLNKSIWVFQVPAVRLQVVKIVETLLSTSSPDRQLEMFNMFSAVFDMKCQVSFTW